MTDSHIIMIQKLCIGSQDSKRNVKKEKKNLAESEVATRCREYRIYKNNPEKSLKK